MGTSVYSFGEESPLKFKIPDKTAKNYNEAVEQWLKAQVRFNQQFGKQWPPKKPVEVTLSKKHRNAWNDFANIFNKVVEQHGGSIHENDIMEDFLVKNVGPAASAALTRSRRWGRIIPAVALCGALYGLLNGRQRDRS